MKKILTILLILSVSSTLYSQDFELIEEGVSNWTTLPKVDWIFYVDASSGYIGMVTNDKSKFTLFSAGGLTAFTTNSKDNNIYSIVRMKQNPGIVLLGTGGINGNKYYEIYDYSGRKVIDKIKTGNIIAASPTGKYFYTINDPGEHTYTSQIFDSNGQEIASYKNGNDYSDMHTINDSLLLYHRASTIKLISIPGLEIQNEINLADSLISLSLRLLTAVSGDGSIYAFTSSDKIVVVDLETGETAHILKDEDELRITNNFVLSQNGEYLIYYKSSIKRKRINIYKKNKSSYEELLSDYLLPDEFGAINTMSDNSVVLDDKYYGLMFFYKIDGRMLHKTYLFELPTKKVDSVDSMILDGFITIDGYAETTNRTFRLNSVKNQNSKLLRIQEK